MDSILISETIAGLQKAKGQQGKIAAEAGVGDSWLNKFSRGVYPDPSARRVERVYRVLVQRGLCNPAISFSSDPDFKDVA